ncbi:MAG TPA: GGDEF domain-containing protein [Candidatus Limnocylindria bacterium]|nr:GGDEF domain-containing protein [Candidatus Limnocylindria bacterium]
MTCTNTNGRTLGLPCVPCPLDVYPGECPQLKVGQDLASLKTDNTALRQEVQTLLPAARYDPLTGLLRPERFRDAAHRVLERARKEGSAALALVDLDDFKGYNDTFNHSAGDRLLRAAGDSLLRHIRPGDVVGRLGGDEFGVAYWSPEPFDEGKAAGRGAMLKSGVDEDITYQVEIDRHLFPSENLEAMPEVSIGVAEWRRDMTFTEAKDKADELMYKNKQRKR